MGVMTKLTIKLMKKLILFCFKNPIENSSYIQLKKTVLKEGSREIYQFLMTQTFYSNEWPTAQTRTSRLEKEIYKLLLDYHLLMPKYIIAKVCCRSCDLKEDPT